MTRRNSSVRTILNPQLPKLFPHEKRIRQSSRCKSKAPQRSPTRLKEIIMVHHVKSTICQSSKIPQSAIS